MAEQHCIKCIIHGRVQGVWFRGSTQGKAAKLGLRGYARNLRDGTVEVLAYGPASGIEALRDWLQQGSPMSRVERVVCEPIDEDCEMLHDGQGFEIR